MDDPIRLAETHLNAILKEEHQVPALPCSDVTPSQQRITHSASSAVAERLREQATPFDRARMIAYSALMVGRWLAAAPSKTFDMHMSGAEVSITSCMHLGVDVLKGGELCRFCGAVLDAKGVHAASCMSGGDVNLRHNRVRNTLYRYGGRGQLNAELEKAGVLDEDGIFVDLCRPADIMIDGMEATRRGSERIALDVKIINALGAGHYPDTPGRTPHCSRQIQRCSMPARRCTCTMRGHGCAI